MAQGEKLWVAIEQKQWKTVQRIMEDIEVRISNLVDHRHEFPIWPTHDDALDAFEEEFHAPVRHVYYQNTLYLVSLLRYFRSEVSTWF